MLLADVVKVRMQLQTLQLASDGTRLVAPNLVSAWTSQSFVPLLSLLTFHIHATWNVPYLELVAMKLFTSRL